MFQVQLWTIGLNLQNTQKDVQNAFCIFRAGIPYIAFLKRLNKLHPNLKFSVEVGNLSHVFLDT